MLIKEFPDHIKGYGFISDLMGETYCGLSKDIARQYNNIYTEFIEDTTLEPYVIEELNIPHGTLRVFGDKIVSYDNQPVI